MKISFNPAFYGFQRSFSYPLIVAEVTCPIIGADFLRHFDLLVDLRNYQLIDQSSSRHVNLISGEQELLGISTICEGFLNRRRREKCVLRHRPRPRLPSNTSQRRGHSENGYNYPIRIV
ncbi:hypothetical protein M8J77_013394 [Diaphorina citri]|nr:hypothetical protein M8J77_013394 [Diaphorina citri]